VSARRLAVAFASMLMAGCGVTRLQSARTTPRGLTRTTIGESLVYLGDRGFRVIEGVPPIPLDIMVRHGATDRVDWGIRLLFGLGLLGDVKWNLLDPARATALSVSAGTGAAVDSSAGIIHVPLTVSASHNVRPWFIPYAAVGYGTYWIIGYGEPMPGVSYAGRSYTGDGLLMLHAGIELTRATGRALLLEYSVGVPVVNDPGDFYGFATNQFFSIAFRTGRGNIYGRGLDRSRGPEEPSGRPATVD
jgi:hypothetical protein